MTKRAKNLFALLCCALLSNVLFSQTYPFPTNVDYPYGNRVSVYEPDSIQMYYDLWLERFYVEEGNLARVKFDEPYRTVSEGIAYGMLITVYMENELNNTQGKFNKLWNYYQAKSCGKGLMGWNVNGFGDVLDCNAATDAELDVIMALLLAHKQWGSEGGVNYMQAAQTLIGLVWDREISGDVIKAGDYDRWDTNPSYFITCAIQLFKQFDPNPAHNWDAVIAKCYSNIFNNRNDNTGLVSDWCDFDGNPSGDFHYDAVRTPWRMSWTYAWYGHREAYDVSNKIATWVRAKHNDVFHPDTVLSSWTLDGQPREDYGDATFHGAFAAAAMVDSTHSKWMNDGYQILQNNHYDTLTYYNHCLRILYMLTLSGNSPNFYDMGASFRSASLANDGSSINVAFTNGIRMPLPQGDAGFVIVKNNGELVAIDSLRINELNNRMLEIVVSEPFTFLDANITIAFQQGELQSTAGGLVESFSEVSVENTIPGAPAALLQAYTNELGTEITAVFNKELNLNNGSAEEFLILQNYAQVAVSSLSLNPNNYHELVFSLANSLLPGQLVLLSYLGGDILTVEGGVVAEFRNYGVTNNINLNNTSGFVDDFNDNTLTNWDDPDGKIETFDESGEQLHITGSCANNGYQYFQRTFAPVNIENNPVLIIDMMSPASDVTVRIDLMQSLGDGTYLKSNKESVEFTVSGDNTWSTYTYDFTNKLTQYYADNGSTGDIPLDPTKIDGIAFYLNPGNCYDGEIYFDNVQLGDVPPEVPVTSLSAVSEQVAVELLSSLQLMLTILPESASDKRIIWSTTDATIATVDEYGLVTGVGLGVTTITAQSAAWPSVTYSFELTVENITVADTLWLHEGFNLLSVPLITDNNSISHLFSGARLVKTDSLFWDATYPNFANTLQSVEPYKTYIVYADSSFAIPIQGTQAVANGSCNLFSGWSTFTYLGATSPVSEALAGIADYFEIIKNYTSFYDATGNGDLAQLIQGESYFIKVTENCTIEYAGQ